MASVALESMYEGKSGIIEESLEYLENILFEYFVRADRLHYVDPKLSKVLDEYSVKLIFSKQIQKIEVLVVKMCF